MVVGSAGDMEGTALADHIADNMPAQTTQSLRISGPLHHLVDAHTQPPQAR
jgi:hypothetical protein